MSIIQVESTLYSQFKSFLNHPSDVYLDHKSMQGPTCDISGLSHSVLLRITAISCFLELIWQHRSLVHCHSEYDFKGRGCPVGQTLGFDFCYLSSQKHSKLHFKFSQLGKVSQGKNSLRAMLISQISYFLCVCFPIRFQPGNSLLCCQFFKMF